MTDERIDLQLKADIDAALRAYGLERWEDAPPMTYATDLERGQHEMLVGSSVNGDEYRRLVIQPGLGAAVYVWSDILHPIAPGVTVLGTGWVQMVSFPCIKTAILALVLSIAEVRVRKALGIWKEGQDGPDAGG